MYWYWIHVYNNEQPLGSFYTQSSRREDVVREINREFGEYKWTRFTSE